ncbi:High temperature protein G [Martelella mediterranea DSM 17316]|uniref:High temperature protein G n=2 Tax=Martelella mediterranea TaxID=293089 RepID=A0A1U9Z1G2_9HYPH|nr:High temperature protein G [Martelella mediterranea DSM 17316]
MFPVSVINSSLWSSAFRDQSDHSDVIQRLITSLTIMRSKAGQLSSLVRADFPDLTAHDVSHLDALWEVGSTICGPSYPINPLEGFILGASILLHDTALSFTAYEGGADKLRETTVWKDNYSFYHRSNRSGDDEVARNNADFATVRYLHASECRELAVREWRRDDRNGEYLIDDAHLRNHYGELIGDIAGSHHWDIDHVADHFNEQKNPTGELPPSWVVHPLKLACILRCADAGHIDGRRAPDFLLSVLARNRVSQSHWLAQNYLSRLCEHQADRSGQTLSINSTRPFKATEAPAWWVAKEAIDILSKEIRDSNKVLADYERPNAPAFKRKFVYGAEDTASLTLLVTTQGWHPTEAKVKIGNVESVVTQLGGDQLYDGQTKFGVVLRELIQNARDAICARQIIEPTFKNGAVKVSLEKSDDGWVLVVKDNGVGMSESTLTGHLLDFGSSFWKSQLIQSEWPGLLSSSFQSSGRFGIGFFSSFMIANSLTISSRRFSSDITSFRTLEFQNGMTLRPLLSSTLPPDVSTDLSTRVAVKLNSGLVNQLGEVLMFDGGHRDRRTVPFCDFLGATTALLDVPVYYLNESDQSVLLPSMPDQLADHAIVLDWISTLNAHEYGEKISEHIDPERDLTRLRYVYDNEKKVGLAALDIGYRQGYYYSHGMVGISGLISLDDGGNSNIIGAVSVPPSGAARETRTDNWIRAIAHASASAWLVEQVSILAGMDIQLKDIQDTIQNVVGWGFDAYPIWKENQFMLDGEVHLVKNSDLLGFVGSRTILFNIDLRRHMRPNQVNQHIWLGPSGYKRNFDDEILYLNEFTILSGDDYWDADYSNPDLANQNCLIGYFERYIQSQGCRSRWEEVTRSIKDEDGGEREVRYLALNIEQ